MDKIQINSMSDLSSNAIKIPFEALQDINNRICGWMASGGDIEDGYIKQQFRYAENIINVKGE